MPSEKITLPAVDREYVDCLIDMAGYAIGYWAQSAETTPDGYTIVVEDDNEVHCLTYDQIWWARLMVCTGQAGQVNPTLAGYLASGDAADVDAECADIVIQVACFGEIVYG